MSPSRLSFLLLPVLACLACAGPPNRSEVIGGPTVDAMAAASCMTLAGCCPSLPSEVVVSCQKLAAETSSAECAAELTALAAAKQCQTIVPPDAASPPPDVQPSAVDASTGQGDAAVTDAGSAVGCILLEACCMSASLPSADVATCESLQGGSDETDCASLLTDLTASGDCTGTNVGMGGACPDLSTCCSTSSFPSEFLTSCLGAVMQGDETACATDLATYGPAGYCGDVLPGPDGGHPTTANCATLAMCCNEITFPMSALAECQSIVSANEDGNCLSAYDSYAILTYCE